MKAKGAFFTKKRRAWRAMCGLVLVALAAPVAGEDTQPRVARLEAAFETWLDSQGVPGVMAVRRQGETRVVSEHGVSQTDQVELASVSKSITAMCAAELVRTDQMDWADSFRDTVGRGPDVPLSAFVAHASGLVTDSTQDLMLSTLDTEGGHQSQQVLDAIENRGGPSGPVGTFAYNNENYAMVALMIEAATGRPYQDVCHEMAVVPAGVTAQASVRLPSALPWGSWTMTASDYAQFHAHWFGDMQDPTAFPYVEAGGGVHYGLGTFFRVLDRGNTFWHFGALCFPGQYQRGSFAVTWFSDWTVFAAYEGCVDWDAMFALDQALATAVFGPLP